MKILDKNMLVEALVARLWRILSGWTTGGEIKKLKKKKCGVLEHGQNI